MVFVIMSQVGHDIRRMNKSVAIEMVFVVMSQVGHDMRRMNKSVAIEMVFVIYIQIRDVLIYKLNTNTNYCYLKVLWVSSTTFLCLLN